MNTRNNIIESLSQNRINETGILKVGDRIKFMTEPELKYRYSSNFSRGDVWSVAYVEPSGYIFYKVKNDGTISKTTAKGNMAGMQDTELERLMNIGAVKILTPNDPVTLGEISIETIKQLLKDVGVDTLTGIPLNTMVTTSGADIKITLLKIDDKHKDLIISKILDVLKRNKIPVALSLSSAIFIHKIQGVI
jgi:hypothetical protein